MGFTMIPPQVRISNTKQQSFKSYNNAMLQSYNGESSNSADLLVDHAKHAEVYFNGSLKANIEGPKLSTASGFLNTKSTCSNDNDVTQITPSGNQTTVTIETVTPQTANHWSEKLKPPGLNPTMPAFNPVSFQKNPQLFSVESNPVSIQENPQLSQAEINALPVHLKRLPYNRETQFIGQFPNDKIGLLIGGNGQGVQWFETKTGCRLISCGPKSETRQGKRPVYFLADTMIAIVRGLIDCWHLVLESKDTPGFKITRDRQVSIWNEVERLCKLASDLPPMVEDIRFENIDQVIAKLNAVVDMLPPMGLLFQDILPFQLRKKAMKALLGTHGCYDLRDEEEPVHRIQQLEHRIVALATDKAALLESESTLGSGYVALRKAKEESENRIEYLTATVEELGKAKEEGEDRIEHLTAKVEELRRDADINEDDYNRLSMQNNQLSMKNDELSKQNEQLTANLQFATQARTEHLGRQIQRLQEKVAIYEQDWMTEQGVIGQELSHASGQR